MPKEQKEKNRNDNSKRIKGFFGSNYHGPYFDHSKMRSLILFMQTENRANRWEEWGDEKNYPFIRDDETLDDIEVFKWNNVMYLGNKRGMYMERDGEIGRRCEVCGAPIQEPFGPEVYSVIKNVNSADDLDKGNFRDVSEHHYLCLEHACKFASMRDREKHRYLCDLSGTVKNYVYIDRNGKCAVPRISNGKPMQIGDLYYSRDTREEYMLIDSTFGGFTPYLEELRNIVYMYVPERENPFVYVGKDLIGDEYVFYAGLESLKYGVNCGIPVYVAKDDCRIFEKKFLAGRVPEAKFNPDEDIIYGYHSWEGEYKPLVMPDENPEKTILFGIELETEGDEENVKYLRPYADLCHAEYDSSIDGFEIIFQPMSWRYLMSVSGRLSALFSTLRKVGQTSDCASTCGLHIHVSYLPLGETEAERSRAVDRIVAIVNGLQTDMTTFSRRGSTQYSEYSADIEPNDETLGYDVVKKVKNNGRYTAVNCCNFEEFDPSEHADAQNKNTVEFRMCKGSLNTFTVLASVELIKHIVETAMSDTEFVSFNDLSNHGVYLPMYIMTRRRRGRHFSSAVVYLGYLDFTRAVNSYYSGDLSDDAFAVICRKAKADHASFDEIISEKMKDNQDGNPDCLFALLAARKGWGCAGGLH